MDEDVIRPRRDDRTAADDHGAWESDPHREGESDLTVDTVGFGGTKISEHRGKPQPAADNEDVFHAQWDTRKHTIRKTFPKLSEKDIEEVNGRRSVFIQKLMEHYRWTRDDSAQKIDMWTGGDLETIDHPGP
jgi:hypothetical protein